MFVVAIAMFAASVAVPPRDPAAEARQTRVTRKARPAARRTVRIARTSVQMRRLVPATNAVDRNAQYRLPLGNTDGVFDPKMRAVRDEGMACGVTGAPVCPSKGATVLTSQVD